MVFDLQEKFFKVSVQGLNRFQAVELDNCIGCATCAEACPIYKCTLNPKCVPAWKVKSLRRLVNREKGFFPLLFGSRKTSATELSEMMEYVFKYCTLCGRCMEGCAPGMQNQELFEIMRETLYKLGFLPDKLKNIRSSLEESKDPYNMGVKARLYWVKRTKLKGVRVGEKTKYIFFVGCSSAFKKINRMVPFHVSNLLSMAGVKWSLLGEDEWCCGSPWLMLGDREKFKEFALHNTHVIEEKEAETVLVACASCYRTMKYVYPRILRRKPSFEVKHVIELLNDFIQQGKIRPIKGNMKVTYHDPCELSRLGGIIKEPRSLIKALTSNFIEIKENGLRTRCCGGGGLLSISNAELQISLAKKRIQQAADLGVEAILSACPSCRMSLTQANELLQLNMKVMDVVEFLVEHLKT